MVYSDAAHARETAQGATLIEINIDITEEPPQVIVTEHAPYPIDHVWLVHTDELYLKTWWAPTGYQNTWAEANPKPGGTWKIVQRDPEGNEFSFYGRYEMVERPARIAMSRTSELFPDTPTTLRLDFTPTESGTTIVTTEDFTSVRHLRGFLALGGLERLKEASIGLDALLAQMAPSADED